MPDINISLDMFLDYTKCMKLGTKSLYVLMPHSDNPSERSIVIGPFMQWKHIKRSQVREHDSPLRRSTGIGEGGEVLNSARSLHTNKQQDFEVSVDFGADGAKNISVKLQHLQLYLQLDILWELQHFFTCNFPDYEHALVEDRPNFYDSDEGNLPRFEMQACLHDNLICFDQFTTASNKTIAFQGQLEYYYVKEKVNEVKQRLAEQPPDTERKLRQQQKLKTSQVHLIDFQPFFCEVEQLHRGDLPLHHLTKRQLVSPFNLYFNSTDLIELEARRAPKARGSVADASADVIAQRYKLFKKQELNLDLCEVHVSFNDLLCLKGIKRRLDEMDEAYHDYLGGVEALAAHIFEPSEADIDSSDETKSLVQLRNNIQSIRGEDSARPAEFMGIDQTQIVSHGIKLLLINDKDHKFLPVLSLNFAGFTINWDKKLRETLVWADMQSSINFFNGSVGVWEPFFEPFDFVVYRKTDDSGALKNVEIDFHSAMNVNFTEKLVANLHESFTSWHQVSASFEMALGSPDTDKPGQSRSDDQEVITPYVIVNQTDMAIAVQRRTEQRAIGMRKYTVQSGKSIDYVIDYQNNQRNRFRASSADETHRHGEAPDIHQDTIGEYQPELIRVQFDGTSVEVEEGAADFAENREIKSIDLNRVTLKSHLLREGPFTEKIFYGVKVVNFKKVLTIRCTTLLTNKTEQAYVVHIRLAKQSVVKALPPGASLPLSNRLDKAKMQLKLSEGFDGEMEAQGYVEDFRKVSTKWSALIPLSVIKYRLKPDEGSFLKTSQSQFVFIRKEKADSRRNTVDICLLTPMVVKNCLPLAVDMKFVDSSGQQRSLHWSVDEQRSLSCFSLAQTVVVELTVQGFVSREFKLFDLDNFRATEARMELQNREGQQTLFYAKIGRRGAGHCMTFYARKLLVDQMDSLLRFSYDDACRKIVPGVNLPEFNQRIHMLPEGFTEVSAWVPRSPETSKIDVETPGSQVSFTQQTPDYTMSYCYGTQVFLAAQDAYLYSKITTVNPYFIFVNQSKYQLLVEQASESYEKHHHPLVLAPGQRRAFFFKNINPNLPGIDEFLQVRILDETVTGAMVRERIEAQRAARQSMGPDASSAAASEGSRASASRQSIGSSFSGRLRDISDKTFKKTYAWSTPFMVTEVDAFTLRIAPDVTITRLQEQMAAAQLAVTEKSCLQSMMTEVKYLRVTCKSGQKQAAGSQMIMFEEEPESNCQYRIINECKSLELLYRQHIINNPLWSEKMFVKSEKGYQWAKPGQRQRFTWHSTLHQKVLKLSFAMRYKNQLSKLEIKPHSEQEARIIPSEKLTELLVPFDKIGHTEEVSLVLEVDVSHLVDIKGPVYGFSCRVKLEVGTNGFTKYLKITEIDEATAKKSGDDVEPEATFALISVKVNKLFLSLINKNAELMTVFLHKIKLDASETNKHKTVKFSLGYMQVDNQSESEPAYPVLLKPRDLHFFEDKIALRAPDGLKPSDDAKMFQFQITQKKQATEDVLYIDNVTFLLQALDIKVQFRHFLRLADYGQAIYQIMDRSVNFVHYLFVTQRSENAGKRGAPVMDFNSHNWRSADEIRQSQWRLFIQSYQSSPMEIYVSAMNQASLKDGDNPNTPEQEVATAMLGAFGEKATKRVLYFSTFEDMCFKMNMVHIQNLFGDGNDVTAMLAQYHKDQLKYNIFSLLGSSNLIGNPTRLLSNMGTGFKDFFAKPYQGIMDGSMHTLQTGLYDGSKSLLQNSLMAPVGAVAKIGQSLSKGVAALSFDDQYRMRKAEADKKAQYRTFREGLSMGMSSAGQSLSSGLKGVFSKPKEGWDQEGAVGLLKGGAKGAAGLVAKTVSGGLDLVANSSLGLSNSLAGSADLCQRIRRPRPFYEIDSIIKPYNDAHAFWITVLRANTEGEGEDISQVLEVFMVDEDEQSVAIRRAGDRIVIETELLGTVLIVTHQRLFLIKSRATLERNQDGVDATIQLGSVISKRTDHRFESATTREDILFVDEIGDERSIILIGYAPLLTEAVIEEVAHLGAAPNSDAKRSLIRKHIAEQVLRTKRYDKRVPRVMRGNHWLAVEFTSLERARAFFRLLKTMLNG